MKKIAASIMCADQLNLFEELKKLEHAQIDLLHCDVMDGIYVNNLALGPEYLMMIKQVTSIPLDIHLATITPLKYIDMFADIKPEYISFHIEATKDVLTVLERLKSYGIKASIAINPETPIYTIYPYLNDIDMVLMMTVNPGFSGQSFNFDVLNKMTDLRRKLTDCPKPPLIEVDGNINNKTIKLMQDCSPDVFVLGTSALFHQQDDLNYTQRINTLWCT